MRDLLLDAGMRRSDASAEGRRMNLRDHLGAGAVFSVLGNHAPALGQVPDDVRHLIWGAIGASFVYVIREVSRAVGDRAAAKIRWRVKRSPASAD